MAQNSLESPQKRSRATKTEATPKTPTQKKSTAVTKNIKPQTERKPHHHVSDTGAPKGENMHPGKSRGRPPIDKNPKAVSQDAASHGDRRRAGRTANHSHNRQSANTQKADPTDVVAAATPVKAYAGPTFHASPAASSLPLPKFFSKSVPNVHKTINLATMLENESDSNEDDADESPSKYATKRLGIDVSPSPLDILFRADKESKARQSTRPAPHPDVSPRRIQQSPSVSVSHLQYSATRHNNDQHDLASDNIFTMDLGERNRAPVSYTQPQGTNMFNTSAPASRPIFPNHRSHDVHQHHASTQPSNIIPPHQAYDRSCIGHESQGLLHHQYKSPQQYPADSHHFLHRNIAAQPNLPHHQPPSTPPQIPQRPMFYESHTVPHARLASDEQAKHFNIAATPSRPQPVTRTSSPHIKLMEDDLKRLLKLKDGAS